MLKCNLIVHFSLCPKKEFKIVIIRNLVQSRYVDATIIVQWIRGVRGKGALLASAATKASTRGKSLSPEVGILTQEHRSSKVKNSPWRGGLYLLDSGKEMNTWNAPFVPSLSVEEFAHVFINIKESLVDKIIECWSHLCTRFMMRKLGHLIADKGRDCRGREYVHKGQVIYYWRSKLITS